MARGDVAVSPVHPIFMICDVAPRLHIPIRVPAEVRVSLHQPTSTWDAWTLVSDSLQGEYSQSGASNWLKFQREMIWTVSVIHGPGGSGCSAFSSSSAGPTISSSGCCCSLMEASLFRGQLQRKETGQLFCPGGRVFFFSFSGF